MKVNPNKSSLFLKKVRWCGKIYDGAGVKQDPEKLQGLRDLRNPSTFGELQQFLCGVNWLRGPLPDYARVVRILQELLKEKLAGTPGTKRVARNIVPRVSNQEQMDLFQMVNQLLMKSVKLHYLVETAVVCLFTDASLYGWSVVIAQVVEWDSALPVEKQAHQAIVFLSGCSSKAELNWTITEKEAFPIIMALEKADHILRRLNGFRMYCDHKNLIRIFAPDRNTKKNSVGRLHRWSMKLMSFEYEAYHIAGILNVCADILSRWLDVPDELKSIKGLKRNPTFISDQWSPIDPMGAENMPMPTYEVIAAM